MAEIKAERRTSNIPGIWWALLLVAALLLVGLFTNWFGMAPQANLYNPERPVASITYKDTTWVPRGVPVDYPEQQMVEVGTSPQGYTLYANREQGYTQGPAGGGGGEITPSTEPQAYGRVYLKTTDGRYQPFFMQPQ